MKKKDHDPGIVLDTGPLKGKRLTFAPQDGIDLYEDLAYELLTRVFSVNAAFLSDESSLWDFCDFGQADQKEHQAVWKKIEDLYGVDCRDIQDGNLLAVCQRISRLSLQATKPTDSH